MKTVKGGFRVLEPHELAHVVGGFDFDQGIDPGGGGGGGGVPPSSVDLGGGITLSGGSNGVTLSGGGTTDNGTYSGFINLGTAADFNIGASVQINDFHVDFSHNLTNDSNAGSFSWTGGGGGITITIDVTDNQAKITIKITL
jgi:hypothetical protein